MASAQNLALGPFLFLAEHVVLRGHAFRIVFREPGLRRVGIREDLEVIDVANLLAGVDVYRPRHPVRRILRVR